MDEPGVVRPVNVAHGPAALSATSRALWAVIENDNTVVRIDPATGAVVATIRVGASPADVAVGSRAVWVANARDGTVTRIDPRHNAAAATITVGGRPTAVAVGGGRVWVTVQQPGAAGSGRSKTGGIARINSEHDVGSLDPALAYTPLEQATVAHGALAWQIEYATCAKLLNYPDRPAPFGSTLVPEVADAFPTVSADGRTYTFRIRSGFRFSPPSRERVTAATFKYAIERSLSPRMHGPAGLAAVAAGSGARATLDDVVGADAYAAGRASHVSGIVANGDTLTIRLERPAVDLPDRLALPFFCAVPTDTPLDPNGLRRIPAAGPYYIAAYTPGQQIVLKRNPRYGGGRPRHLDELRITLGVSQTDTVEQLAAAEADYALDGVPPQAQTRLRARYGPGSAAAKAGRQRFFVDPTLATYFLALNTSRPLFADAATRRAVAFAVNRRALVRLASAFFTTEPTDQYLPPGSAGFRDARLYPATPDLDTARGLVQGREGTAVLYTLTSSLPVALLVQAYLAPIGIHVDIRTFAADELRERLGTRGEPFDLTIDAWSADMPDPAAMLAPLLDGDRIAATRNTNIAYFDDPAVTRRLHEAARLTGPKRNAALGALDVAVARTSAPYVALANVAQHDVFSRRIGCQIAQPVYGIDLAALCLR
jgi:YVTN family beta-propeller protein